MIDSGCSRRLLMLILFIVAISCKKDSDKEEMRCSGIAVTTGKAYNVTPTSAYSAGIVQNSESCNIVSIGVCWSISSNPTISDNAIVKNYDNDFSFRLTGLIPNTTYYTRAFAIVESDVFYGNTDGFITPDVKPPVFNSSLNYGTLTDIDNNTYKIIEIGNKVWLAENLRTTRYNDGTSIREVTEMSDWIDLKEPAYCYYDFDATVYKNTYGALYNWYCVNTGKLCPEGWHVPDLDEWNHLITFIGGKDAAGVKLKETGSNHWLGNNGEATNLTGFTALPGAIIHGEGGFLILGESGFFWSSTVDASWLSETYAFSFLLSKDTNEIIVTNSFAPHGESVRCVKDQKN